MKKSNCVFIFFFALMLTVLPCIAEEGNIPGDGLYTLGVQSNSRMFNITKCVLHVEQGQMTAVITLSGDGYGYAYVGTAKEADNAQRDTWIPYVEDWDGAYTYALPITVLDEEVAVAAYSKRYSKWYDRTLVFHSRTLAPYDEVAPDGVYNAILLSEGETQEGQECILISKNGEMMVETADGFSGSLASLDKWVLSETVSQIMVRMTSLTEHVVRAADGKYQAEVMTDSSLLRFQNCTLMVADGQMTAILTAKNNNFDYLYVGSAAEALMDEVGWIPAFTDENGAYTYVLVLPSLDNEIPIATYSGKKKMWYDRTICIDSDSLKIEGGENE